MEKFDGSLTAGELKKMEDCDHHGFIVYKDEYSDDVMYLGICFLCGACVETSREQLERAFNNV